MQRSFTIKIIQRLWKSVKISPSYSQI